MRSWCFPNILLALAGLALLASACSPEKNDPLPINGKPEVRRLSPSQPSVLDTAGATVELSFVLADNEALASWRLVAIINNQVTTLVEEDITGTDLRRNYSYTIPTLPRLTQIRIRAYVTDNIGQIDSTDVLDDLIISVDFIRDTTQPYAILSYTNDTLYNRLSIVPQQGFNLLLRRWVQTNNAAAMDIQETTAAVSLDEAFEREFRSPNNAANGNTDVFVVLSPAEFNYDQLTYTTMLEAWSANPKSATTGRLNEGDIVIMRLNLEPHLAAIRIKQINDNGALDFDDYIVFDYKRSEN
jgi:hypothetical protein